MTIFGEEHGLLNESFSASSKVLLITVDNLCCFPVSSFGTQLSLSKHCLLPFQFTPSANPACGTKLPMPDLV